MSIFLPAVRYTDTKAASQCNFRNKNCGIQSQPGRFSGKFPEEIMKLEKVLKAYEFVDSFVQTKFILLVVELSVLTFISAKRVLWAVDTARRAISAAGTRTGAI